MCFWCEVLKEMLGKILEEFGYSIDVVREINVDSERIGCERISSLPTIDICGKRLVGMQDESTLASKVLQTIGNRRFPSL